MLFPHFEVSSTTRGLALLAPVVLVLTMYSIFQVVAASMAINIASCHAAYVVCLGIALAIAASHGHAGVPVLLASVLFLLFSVVVSAGLQFLAGRDVARVTARLHRFPALRNAVVFLKDAEPHLTHHAPLLVEAIVWQAFSFLLDAATMWVFIQSLLGTFQATSVWTLSMIGVSVPIGLAATLLFRGFSFWLPMLPGWWMACRISAGPEALSVARARPFEVGK